MSEWYEACHQRVLHVLRSDGMYEMDDLTRPSTSKTSEPTQEDEDVNHAESNDVVVWAYASSSFMAISGIVFLLFPRVLLFLSTPPSSVPRSSLTELENFLSTLIGLLSLALAVSLLVSIPSDYPLSPSNARHSRDHPLLYPLTGAATISSLVAWNVSSLRVGLLGPLMSASLGVIALWGLWVILFQNAARRSKRTGADKHSSAFLFSNRNAASIQRRLYTSANKK